MKYWADNGDEGGRAVEIKFSATAAAGHTLVVSLRVTSAGVCLIMYGGGSSVAAAGTLPLLSTAATAATHYPRCMEVYKFVGEGM